MIISSEFKQDDSKLVVSYYDEAGNVAYAVKHIHDADQFNWKLTGRPSEYRNWDNKFVDKSKSKWLSRFRIEELIQTRFSEEELAQIYSDHNPKKYFLDIEIQLTSNEFPDPAKAAMPVNLISFCGPDNVTYILSTMKKLDNEAISKMESEINEYLSAQGQVFTIKYMFFEKEEDLMSTFFHRILPKLPFITGWNVIEFDWKYLINRCKRLNIKPMESMVCDKLIGKGQSPVHLGLLDYLEVFMNLKPIKVVENYKLDYISQLVLGVSKLHHDYGSMMEAQQDVENFVKYNAIDVMLVKLIEDKLSLLDVAFAISKTAQVDVSKVFSAVFITESLMCRHFLRDGKKMASDKRDLAEQVTYEGAYVSKPVPGHHKYVSCFDFSSMYPNVQIQFNISPDTYLGKMKPGHTLKEDEIYTKNGTLFTKKKDSAARVILKSMYDRRMSIKSHITELKQAAKKAAN